MHGRIGILLSLTQNGSRVGFVPPFPSPKIWAGERWHAVPRLAPTAFARSRALELGRSDRRRPDCARSGTALPRARPPGVLVRRGQHGSARALLTRKDDRADPADR